jgi:hypothetical protein
MTSTGLVVCLLVTLTLPGDVIAQSAAQTAATGVSAQELYQRALVQEHAQGDLHQAVALYAQAARRAGNDRMLAAKALIRMAGSQEKLGADLEAARTYAEVISAYPEQRPEVAIAQERLMALRRMTSAEGSPARAATPTDVSSSIRPLVERYCVSCHNAQKRAGGLDLDSVGRRAISENPARWETVIRRLRVRRDPPIGNPRPDDATYRSVVARLEQALDAAYAADRTPLSGARVTGTELAVRLATFLWNGVPDAALRDAAGRGDLHEPATVEREVRRMLRDARSVSLIDNFFGPWLSLDRLKSARPGQPPVDAQLIQAMDTETRLFLESQLREDRDAVELWTATYTYVNDRLARHYGMSGVSGGEFRRVAWPDTNRAGLLGQAGPLTALSMGSRTSPTMRGVYVLTRFLGMDAPSPPANVPALAEEPPGPGAMRDRILAHKTNPSCASCHSLFDPFGLALEQFDATGRWRSTDGASLIDASGTFLDGSRFNGPAELRDGLLKYRESYYTALTERLLAHALNRKGNSGRVYEYEMPAVRKIVRDASIAGYRWSSLLAGIVASAPFQMKNVVP